MSLYLAAGETVNRYIWSKVISVLRPYGVGLITVLLVKGISCNHVRTAVIRHGMELGRTLDECSILMRQMSDILYLGIVA